LTVRRWVMKWIGVAAVDVVLLVGLLAVWMGLRAVAELLAERGPQCGCHAMAKTGKDEMTCRRCGLIVGVGGEEG